MSSCLSWLHLLRSWSLRSTRGGSSKGKAKRKTKPKKPRSKDHIEYDKELAEALEKIGSDKLDSLYYSICSIGLGANTPLLTIGVWAFLETLTALAGRNENTDFVSFLNIQRLGDMGLGDKTKTGAIRNALSRIQQNGNVTKHHQVSATFDGKQLANDVATMTPLLKKMIEDLAPKK